MHVVKLLMIKKNSKKSSNFASTDNHIMRFSDTTMTSSPRCDFKISVTLTLSEINHASH